MIIRVLELEKDYMNEVIGTNILEVICKRSGFALFTDKNELVLTILTPKKYFTLGSKCGFTKGNRLIINNSEDW